MTQGGGCRPSVIVAPGDANSDDEYGDGGGGGGRWCRESTRLLLQRHARVANGVCTGDVEWRPSHTGRRPGRTERRRTAGRLGRGRRGAPPASPCTVCGTEHAAPAKAVGARAGGGRPGHDLMEVAEPSHAPRIGIERTEWCRSACRLVGNAIWTPPPVTVAAARLSVDCSRAPI